VFKGTKDLLIEEPEPPLFEWTPFVNKLEDREIFSDLCKIPTTDTVVQMAWLRNHGFALCFP